MNILRDWYKRFVENMRLYNARGLMRARLEFGGNRKTAMESPDTWQSMKCLRGVCGECPSDRYKLRCHCDCHKKQEEFLTEVEAWKPPQK